MTTPVIIPKTTRDTTAIGCKAEIEARPLHTSTEWVLMKKMFIQCRCCVLLEITLMGFALSFWSAHILHTPTTSWSIIMHARTFDVHEDNILFVRAWDEGIHPVRIYFPQKNKTTLPFFPTIGTWIFLVRNKPNIAQWSVVSHKWSQSFWVEWKVPVCIRCTFLNVLCIFSSTYERTSTSQLFWTRNQSF